MGYIRLRGITEASSRADGKYHVEAYWYYGTMLDDYMTLAECKSLASAKRWVTMNLL